MYCRCIAGPPLQNSEQSLKVSLTGIAVVHCSSQTAPKHVLQKLMQFCRTMSSNVGRVSETHLFFYCLSLTSGWFIISACFADLTELKMFA